MGKGYSEDFRLRVLERIDAGLSKMQAHKTCVKPREELTH